jgi:parallel beta-helix repeat protein
MRRNNVLRAKSLLCASPKTGAVKTAVVVLTVASVGVINAGSAVASHLRCGDTITSDTKLNADLVNCPNNGIVIGADNITLNLNGHTIDGNATAVSDCPPTVVCDVGVVNSAGYDGVTIEGGDIRQFGLGVLVEGGTRRSRLHTLLVADNSDVGIIVANSTRAVITHNRLPDDGTSGIGLISSHGSRVVCNAVSGTTGFAMFLFGVRSSHIGHNTLRHDKHGFQVGDDSIRNTLRHNVVIRSGGGFDIGGDNVTANRIVHNRLAHDGDAIVLGRARHTVIKHNRATRTGFGFTDTGGFGVLLDGTSDTTVLNNRITGSRGPAIWVTSLENPITPRHNVISHNIANSKLDDGIRVDKGAANTTISRNTANHNGDDGLDVQAPDTTVTGNTANFNVDLGIEAVSGVIDGGGNKARGNGNPAQCTNIRCK